MTLPMLLSRLVEIHVKLSALTDRQGTVSVPLPALVAQMPVQRRTLQRYLAALVSFGLIESFRSDHGLVSFHLVPLRTGFLDLPR
jgi:hypothetical protein